MTFLDAQGAPVITCAGSADQDEQTSGETHGLCRRVTGKIADWARVAQVKLEASVEED